MGVFLERADELGRRNGAPESRSGWDHDTKCRGAAVGGGKGEPGAEREWLLLLSLRTRRGFINAVHGTTFCAAHIGLAAASTRPCTWGIKGGKGAGGGWAARCLILQVLGKMNGNEEVLIAFIWDLLLFSMCISHFVQESCFRCVLGLTDSLQVLALTGRSALAASQSCPWVYPRSVERRRAVLTITVKVRVFLTVTSLCDVEQTSHRNTWDNLPGRWSSETRSPGFSAG